MRAWTIADDVSSAVEFVVKGPLLERGETVEVVEMQSVASMVGRIKSALDSLSYAAPEMWPTFFGHIKDALAEFEERQS